MIINDGRIEGNPPSVHKSTARLSRRSFLKSLGLLTVGAVVTIRPITATPAVSGQVGTEPWEIALASPLTQQALNEMAAYGISFETLPTSFHLVSTYENLTGLMLSHQDAPTQRTGADLILTVDVAANILAAAQYLIGWCLDGALEIHGVTLDAREPWIEETTPGIVEVRTRRYEQHWSFPRDPASIPPPPDPLPEEGWPADSDSMAACYWFYDGCQQTDWGTVAETPFTLLRGVSAEESRACQSDERRTVVLD